MKKHDWFEEWLIKENYVMWFEYHTNEVFKNNKYCVVWHESYGMRLMIPLDYFSKEYLRYVFIPKELDKQKRE